MGRFGAFIPFGSYLGPYRLFCPYKTLIGPILVKFDNDNNKIKIIVCSLQNESIY